MHDGVFILPLRTPTLPPATHTNSWVVGEGALTVIDPPSPWPDEQQRLFEELESRLVGGEAVERIVLTHHHHDHVSGVESLRQALGGEVPVLAHAKTRDLLQGTVRVDGLLDEGDVLEAGGRHLHIQHTPGHAPGHLVFHDREAGWMIAGDMVAGTGTILLHPAEGDLGHYLDSLERMRARKPRVLLPSHGPDLPDADNLLSMYVAHRHMRSDQARRVLQAHGRLTVPELVAHVYAELDPRYHSVAALQLRTHLAWMQQHGLARADGDTHWTAA